MDWRSLFFGVQGRTNRQPYWIANLVMAIVALFLITAINLAIYGEARLLQDNSAGEFVSAFILLWPSIAVTVKRFHDRDKSGWWILILLVPVVGFFWWLVECGFLRGTAGSNRFGPNPLGSA